MPRRPSRQGAALRVGAWTIVGAVVVVTYVPILMLFVFSFTRSRSIAVWGGFTTEWYGELLHQHELWRAMLTSSSLAIVVSLVSTILGLCAAWGLPRMRPATALAATCLLSLPLVMPDVIIGAALAIGFNVLNVPRSLATVACGHVVYGLSYAYVVLAAGVAKLDASLPEAARDLGASPRQAFQYVTLPLLWPHLVLAALLVAAVSFDDFLVTFFCKGVGYDTLPIRLYAQMRFGIKPVTNAMFVVLFVIAAGGGAIAAMIGTWIERSRESSRQTPA